MSYIFIFCGFKQNLMKITTVGAFIIIATFTIAGCSKCYTCSTPIYIETPDGDTIKTDATTEQKTCDKGSMETLVVEGYNCVLTQ